MKLIVIAASIFLLQFTVVNAQCSDSSTSCATWVTNGFCTNTFYTTAQRCQYCASSCSSLGCCTSSGGGSGNGTCVNSDSRCTTWVTNGFCTNTFYTTAQRCQYCASSCSSLGCCNGGGGTCSDADTRCATWASNGFCSSTFYTQPQKCQYCANTCNLCSSCPTAATTDASEATTIAGSEATTQAGSQATDATTNANSDATTEASTANTSV